MTPQEQIPKIDAEVRKIDAEIQKHMSKKFKIQRLLKKLYGMMDYRDRRIRELGAERSRVATFELELP